jgi:hypothetical protein
MTLDQMLTSLDIIIAHFKACRARFPNNEPFLGASTTSWFALDKYLQGRGLKAWVKPAIDRASSI